MPWELISALMGFTADLLLEVFGLQVPVKWVVRLSLERVLNLYACVLSPSLSSVDLCCHCCIRVA